MEVKTPLYEAPQVELMEIEVEQPVLQASNFDTQDGNWPSNY